MEEKQGKKTKSLSIVTVVLLAVFLGMAALSTWSFYNYKQAEKKILELSSMEGQQKLAEDEVSQLLEKIKEHMMLPDDETPTIASVTDVEKLKAEQPFFDNAQNGDKVVIYSENRKAIIYSPDRDVIVNVGTIYVDDNQVSQEGIDEVEPEAELETPEELEETEE